MDKILDKIYSIERASFKVFEWNENNETVVFTNGCFDILHYGHISYLYEAKELGHKLIVGINTDDSIKRLKGEDRPICMEDERLTILSNFPFIDMLILFDDITPIKLIKTIKPDIIFKGGDYETNDVVGNKEMELWGGKVIILEYEKGKSTTNLIKRIKK